MTLCRSLATLLAAFAQAAPVVAGSVVLTPVSDNTIFSNGNSNGAGDSVFSGRTGNFSNPPGIRQRAVLAFDVAGTVPAGSTVTSASLTLTLVAASIFGQPETHTLHRLLRDWGEGTSVGFGGAGAPPTAGDATWSHTFYPDQFWALPGSDYAATASASAVVGTAVPQAHTWASTPEMVADVQLWLDDPQESFGWVLLGDEANFNTARRFGSRESGFPDQVPMLSIEFEAPSSCPQDCAGGGDSTVDIVDLLDLLSQWETAGSCDIDGDGVSITDLIALLSRWGPCP